MKNKIRLLQLINFYTFHTINRFRYFPSTDSIISEHSITRNTKFNVFTTILKFSPLNITFISTSLQSQSKYTFLILRTRIIWERNSTRKKKSTSVVTTLCFILSGCKVLYVLSIFETAKNQTILTMAIELINVFGDILVGKRIIT